MTRTRSTLAILAVLALALCACASFGPGRSQQLLAKYGLALDTAISGMAAIHVAAAYACGGEVPPGLSVEQIEQFAAERAARRPACERLDTVAAAMQLVINKCGVALERANNGASPDLENLFIDLALEEARLIAEAQKAGIKWH